jgi:DNA-binding HxlR family transcriptional regulator
MTADESTAEEAQPRGNCCPLYHEADGPLRFSEIAQAIPELSDRLLSERMKELEGRGIVERTVIPGPPLRVRYELSTMGRDLEPALAELQNWARRWLGGRSAANV